MEALLLVAVVGTQAALFPNANSEAAAKAAAKAYAKQSGLETQAKEWERQNVDPTLRAWVGHAALLTKTITEQRVTFTWRFP